MKKSSTLVLIVLSALLLVAVAQADDIATISARCRFPIQPNRAASVAMVFRQPGQGPRSRA